MKGTRKCNICKKDKKVTDFPPTSDQVYNRCKECSAMKSAVNQARRRAEKLSVASLRLKLTQLEKLTEIYREELKIKGEKQ